MFAQLGDIKFSPLPIKGREATHAWEYAEHPLIEGKPDTQWVAESLQSGTLTMLFHRGLGDETVMAPIDPQAELNKLLAAAKTHDAQTLILGDGTIKGSFVITEIRETVTHADKLGRPISLEVTVSLKEFGRFDPLALAVKKKKAQAAGIKRSGTKASTPARRAGGGAKKSTRRRPAVRRSKADVSLKEIVRQHA